ncbi:hypothetical protein PWT90_04437 [Aphanocladium album]|nr:hypothetical protein PWT90_04437 [Aphanocladium album]
MVHHVEQGEAVSSSAGYIKSLDDWVGLSEKLTAQLAASVLGGALTGGESIEGDFSKGNEGLENRIEKINPNYWSFLGFAAAAAELAAALEHALPSKAIRSNLQKIANTFEQTLFLVKFKAIMDLLKFQPVSERFESITKAEESIFSWLLDGSSNDQILNQEVVHIQAKERLQTWIKQKQGFFYVSCKPGAGKSTLMKLICSHPSFVQHATEWAADSCLIAGRFFFWKPGHAEQKTRVGAMVLEYRDVENAFNNIPKAASMTGSYKIILMIDGLDEVDGNHADLLELMQAWVSTYPSIIKICVSSREYGVFEYFFLEGPKMRLHELTRGV